MDNPLDMNKNVGIQLGTSSMNGGFFSIKKERRYRHQGFRPFRILFSGNA
jgi:hypothetical protein